MSRDQKDAKLKKGCEAAISITLEDGYSVKKIKRTTFAPSQEFGSGYRHVTIFAQISDGWLDLDKEYHCTFAETPGGLSYHAELHQMKFDDTYYGIKDGVIQGDANTLIHLENTIKNAMQ